ncbi:ParA family protein [Photobacterium ganghwense]|uniref:ParA family protein n=1 Tax=Photobacterium ganghwense TaxID=320778 RepID=UPI001A8C9F4E|nr:ParA family protein [Photobacterium ganghwense]QSV17580.1 ParA family protein [Photobacterium ganghwense]
MDIIERLIGVGDRAQDSRERRAKFQQVIKRDYSTRLYSKREFQQHARLKNRPVGDKKLSEVIENLENEGHQFQRSKSNTYQLTMEDCFVIAERLGIEPYRSKQRKAFVTIFQNLKGGVGKSLGTAMIVDALTLMDRYLLEQHRVLVIDLDPQATITQHFCPEYVQQEDSITSILAMMRKDLTRDELYSLDEHGFYRAIQKTHNSQVDVLPCVSDDGFLPDLLDDPEYCGKEKYFNLLLNRIIKLVEYDYDFIFLDAGPHMDKVMKNCLVAAHGFFVPVPPTFFNFDSTTRFLEKLPMVYEGLRSEGAAFDRHKFIAAYISKDPSNSNHEYDVDVYENAQKELVDILGFEYVIKHTLPDEDPYERCAEWSTTIFSMNKKDYTGSKDAFDRALNEAKSWAKEIIDMLHSYHNQVANDD